MPTVKEAKKLWCPWAASRVVKYYVRGNEEHVAQAILPDQCDVVVCCLADRCMAWRWDEPGNVTNRLGHCGNAGPTR